MQFCNAQIRTQPLFSPPCASATYGSARMCRRKNVYEQMTILSKEALKTQIIKEIESKIQVELENEAEQKTKVGHWRQWKKEIKIGVTPKYMDKSSRKQCNAIIWAKPILQAMRPTKRNTATYPARLPGNRKTPWENRIQQNIWRRPRHPENPVGKNHRNRRKAKKPEST